RTPPSKSGCALRKVDSRSGSPTAEAPDGATDNGTSAIARASFAASVAPSPARAPVAPPRTAPFVPARPCATTTPVGAAFPSQHADRRATTRAELADAACRADHAAFA